ncbi:heat-shock protein Hsp20 [Mycolicibacterium tusciae]|uniref:Heat-shock protein Hsp20 n=1 Tax=Mycolicibacterium tusciae TaxID=75922 RepID=A0A1X0JTJ8_9MYCO|nr:Hsp20/alpha crystallin family protein [Mycolicibacterium tusciae]ORB66040.1 heat-shock protein Hsp20 [Mycolicibacterium tusciae]
MNKLAVRRQSHPLLLELSELFRPFPGFPTFSGLPSIAGLRPFFDNNLLRMEDETSDGRYEVRVELPGVDPIEDIEVTVRDGELTIKAERTQSAGTDGRSEFSYGSFARTIPLPVGADEDDVHATYDRGILTVSVTLADDAPVEKYVEVIETILVDEDEDDDDDDDDEHDDDAQAELPASENQEQPAG